MRYIGLKALPWEVPIGNIMIQRSQPTGALAVSVSLGIDSRQGTCDLIRLDTQNQKSTFNKQSQTNERKKKFLIKV